MENLLSDKAMMNMKNGYNCAQTVLLAFCKELGLDEERAARLAQPLGAGMGRSGEVCGALSGALMVLGLKYGSADPADKATKEANYARAKAFLAEFAKTHEGAVRCSDLLPCDIRFPEELEKFKAMDGGRVYCAKFVREVIQSLQDTLKQ